MVKMYKPGTVELEAARKINCFILMVNGGYENKIYTAWENYYLKAGISTKNTVGYGRPVKDQLPAVAYWIPYKSPFIDLILAYAKKHPEANMQIFI